MNSYEVCLHDPMCTEINECGNKVYINMYQSPYDNDHGVMRPDPYCIDFDVFQYNEFAKDTYNDFHGFIKWDGCMQWIVKGEEAYQFHFDGPGESARYFATVDAFIWEAAPKLMKEHWNG